MTTKQIRMNFQVENNVGQTNTVIVQLNGVTKFEGTLPETGPLILGGGSYTVTNITFDQDVADWAPTDMDPVSIPLTVTVTGASISLENSEANYYRSSINTGTQEDPAWIPVAGTADAYEICNIIEQPTWNGQALLDRYNIEYNNGPIQVTGPGELIIYSGETVQTVLAVARFNNSV